MYSSPLHLLLLLLFLYFSFRNWESSAAVVATAAAATAENNDSCTQSHWKSVTIDDDDDTNCITAQNLRKVKRGTTGRHEHRLESNEMPPLQQSQSMQSVEIDNVIYKSKRINQLCNECTSVSNGSDKRMLSFAAQLFYLKYGWRGGETMAQQPQLDSNFKSISHSIK